CFTTMIGQRESTVVWEPWTFQPLDYGELSTT
ncbi:MAG: hypothetical protein QOH22_1015, partial [Gemmatimonadaceae bacterium]|nr:hypothetical protein [Gemmatimonadaceae bacterium]